MTLARAPFKPRSAPMARSGFLTRSPFLRKRETTTPRLKSRQRAPTKAEKILWSRMADEVGCIACRLDGHANHVVSIHHIDGRTKPGCHQLVLPLCAGHHQDATGADKTMIAVHPDKARFEQRYGPQDALLRAVHEQLKHAERPAMAAPTSPPLTECERAQRVLNRIAAGRADDLA